MFKLLFLSFICFTSWEPTFCMGSCVRLDRSRRLLKTKCFWNGIKNRCVLKKDTTHNDSLGHRITSVIPKSCFNALSICILCTISSSHENAVSEPYHAGRTFQHIRFAAKVSTQQFNPEHQGWRLWDVTNCYRLISAKKWH